MIMYSPAIHSSVKSNVMIVNLGKENNLHIIGFHIMTICSLLGREM